MGGGWDGWGYFLGLELGVLGMLGECSSTERIPALLQGLTGQFTFLWGREL